MYTNLLSNLSVEPNNPRIHLRLSLALYGISDLRRLLGAIVDAFVLVTGAEGGQVTLFDRFVPRLSLAHDKSGSSVEPFETNIPPSAVYEIARKHKVCFASAGFYIPLVAPSTVEESLGLPNMTLGIFYGEGFSVRYDQEQLESLEILAAHAAMAIENIRLNHMSTVDHLTELYRRRFIMDLLSLELHRSYRHRYPVTVMMMDIDRFKSVNDQHGHVAGDKVLCGVAQALKKGSRKEDLIGRYGGDEFLLILPHTGTHGAVLITERLCESIRNIRFDFLEVPVTVSAGLVSFRNADPREPEEVVRQADAALYKAKSLGRNMSVVIPDPNLSR
ncbi:GGDEF domain-containing protein [bacterium]|nr:GGDEF domain-containing protein [bacterium]